MSDDRELDVLDALRAEVAGLTASPALAARVRTHIANDRAVTFGLTARQWRGCAWAAGCLAALMLIVVLTRDRHTAPIPSIAPGATVAGAGEAAVTTRTPIPVPATRTEATARQPLTRLKPSHPLRVTLAAATTATTADVSAPSIEAPLEVITDQPAIIRAVSARLGASPLVGQTLFAALDLEVPAIVVPTIAVTPIVVTWTEERSTDGPGATPTIKRTIAADMTADRSRR